MNNSSVSFRLTALVALPILVVVICAGVIVAGSLQQHRQAQQTEALMRFGVAAGALIHRLQIERGATAGFIQSNGRKFAAELPDHRAKTDERLAAFTAERGRIDASAFPATLGTRLAEAEKQLGELGETRGKATSFAIAAPQSSQYFSNTIEAMLRTLSSFSEAEAEPAVARKMTAYLALLYAKEWAGRERAGLTPIFVADRLEAGQLQQAFERLHRQETYVDQFLAFAGEDERASYQQAAQSAAAGEVKAMRDTLFAKAVIGVFGVDAQAWFKAATGRIDALHETEKLISGNIVKQAETSLSAAGTRLSVLLVTIAFVLAVTALFSFRVSRSITRPLLAVTEAAEHAVGNDDFTRSVPVGGQDEVGRSAQAFNHLMDKLRQIVRETKSSCEQIASASHALAQSSQEVRQSSASQADASSSVAAAVEQASVSVSETAQSARTTAEIVELAKAEAQRAIGVMNEVVDHVQGITDTVSQSTDNVHLLAENSVQIGGIVKVIKDIADQTNLLALNAAIEAARAGEQGRGFAVVADEVRKLAERTTGATDEIGKIIDTIQGRIDSTVSAMQAANTQAAGSLDLVRRAEESVQHIHAGSERVRGTVTDIAGSIREQDAAVQQIAANIERIAQMTEENSASAAGNSDTAAHLDRLANSLQASVSRFRV
jgi:methyl-accepting chemotaxis protein